MRTAAHVELGGAAQTTLHATALHWLGHGLLLRGASGAGKSDLALRLIDEGAGLIADDLVRLERKDGVLIASAAQMPGAIELRGQGIFALPPHGPAALDVALDLAPALRLERLPESHTVSLLGISLLHLRLDPAAASAVMRLRTALTRRRIA